jgi:hypothetical protein
LYLLAATPAGAEPFAILPDRSLVFNVSFSVTNPNNPVLLFQLSMEQSSPVGATGLFPATFGPGGGTDLPLLLSRSNYLAFPTGQNPPGFQYNHLVYTLSPFPLSIRGQGLTDLTADVGAVPEPATLVFVGTGLLLGAAGRRRTTRSGRG